MRKSFYTWLMAQRNPKSNEPVASFSFNLGQFDQIWEDYLAH